MTLVLAVAAIAIAGAAVGVVLRSARAGSRQAPAPTRRQADASLLATARGQAADAVSQARSAALAARQAAFEELAERRRALDILDTLLAERSQEQSSRREAADERRGLLDERRAVVDAQRAEIAAEREEVGRRLAEVAGTSHDEAAASVLDRVDAELAAEHPGRVARAVADRVGDLVPAARMRIVEAIQRQEVSHADTAPRPSPIALEGLPEEDRERLLSALATVAADTTTDLGVDPERNQATLRGLDPIGREVARQASLEVLERRLSAEQVGPLLLRTRQDLRRRITELGERALWELGVEGRPEVAELLGTLHHRFSYGQNALLHCAETGWLCATLAAELHMDQAQARAAGLLHDIGKAVDHDVEGSHAIIGGELLTVLGTASGIVHAVKAHHFDEEPATDLAMLTICADAISASRPGARRDTLTTYLQRLEQLQQIATRHRGVERAFPMQAGREVRVSVRPDAVPDARVPELCAEIAREIEAEMTYPGMIKVTVIRETAASATAS